MSECYSFVVNGAPAHGGGVSLLRYLRDELCLTSLKDGVAGSALRHCILVDGTGQRPASRPPSGPQASARS